MNGKRVNRGVGLGLKIPVNYFLWRCKCYNMGEKSLEKIDNELQVKVKKSVKQEHACVFLFSQSIIGCPLLNFAPNVHAVLKRSVRYSKCPL